MDLHGILAGLRQELARVDATILMLQKVKDSETSKPRETRGRRSMGAEERLAVSERMKRYWSARRRRTIQEQLGNLLPEMTIQHPYPPERFDARDPRQEPYA
jgi:hypothetical protein